MCNPFRALWIKSRLGKSGKYLEVNNHSFYYETYGSGEPLIMFHGGLSTLETFRFQIPEFSKHFKLILPELRGNGHTADSEGPFSYEQMAGDAIAIMNQLGIKKANLLGYSDGANLILEILLKNPDLIEKFVFVGGNYNHKGCVEAFQEDLRQIPEGSVGEGIDEKYAKYSPDGPEHYATVFSKARKLWLTEPNHELETFNNIEIPGLIISGDKDVIELDHTVSFYNILKKAQLFVVPGTSHSVLKEKPKVLNKEILEFLRNPFPVPEDELPIQES